MSSLSLIILLSFQAQALADANGQDSMKELIDKLSSEPARTQFVDKFINKLAERGLITGTLQGADLDDTTLGKESRAELMAAQTKAAQQVELAESETEQARAAQKAAEA